MKPPSSTTELPGIRELLSYKLHVVANLLSRGAELRYRREFGVSLWEWRAIALLGASREPQSLNALAAAAGVDKSQMSRVISGLNARRLVLRAIEAFKVFDIIYVMTRGGPADATKTVSFFVYQESFTYLRAGSGAAYALTVTAMSGLMIALYVFMLRRREAVS